MAEDKKFMVCDQCGKKFTENDDAVVFALNRGFHMCSDCVEQLYINHRDMVDKHRRENTVKKNGRLTPSSIKAFLDRYVIGQDEAKIVLSRAVYNHYQGITWRQKHKNDKNAVELDRSNVLMLGPTGTGKTFLVKTVSRMLQVPCVIEDSTGFSASGFVGRDVDQILQDLVMAADGEIEKAERGIIYIDEIDKLSRKGENPSISKDVGGEAVQQSLLKIIEGAVVDVAPKGQRITATTQTFKINTENILFICGGSFEGIERIIRKRLHEGKSGMGFCSSLAKEDEKKENVMLQAKVEDLKKFGMLPELLGRLPIICALEEMTEDSLVRILTEPKNAIVKQFKTLVSLEGKELVFTESALRNIAKQAIKRKTGARALRSIMEETLGHTMFELPDHPEITKVTVDVKNDTIVINKR